MSSIYTEYGHCRICGGIATGGVHASDCPHDPYYVAPEERVGQLEAQLEMEHTRGATQERAAIVAWLRAHGFRTSSFVDDIENGEHLKP